VRHELLKAIHDSGVSRSEIAREIGVHRSVVHRQLAGYQDMSLMRVGEIAGAIGYDVDFNMVAPAEDRTRNVPTFKTATTAASGSPASIFYRRPISADQPFGQIEAKAIL
jgi:hypothetical protein